MNDLNLLEPSDAGSDTEHTGTLITLFDKAGSTVASFVAGKEHFCQPPAGSPQAGYGGYPDGRYVLADGAACLIKETLSEIPHRAADWFDTNLASLPKDDIVSVTVTDEDDNTLKLVRKDDSGAMVLTDLAEGETMDKSKADALARVLSHLRLVDVASPTAKDEELGFDAATVCTFTTKQGEVYTLTIGGDPDGSANRYVKLKAEYLPVEEEATDTPEKSDERKQIASKIRQFNERVSRWTYMVNPHAVTAVSVSREGFIKVPDPEET